MSTTSAQPNRQRPSRRAAPADAAAPSATPPERPVVADAAVVQDATVEQGSIMVRRTVYDVESEEPAEVVRVPFFANVAPARVRVAGGMTVSLGNMEFARIDVAVEVPCLPERSEVNRAIDFAESIVGDRLTQQREMIEGMTDGAEQQPE